MFPSLAHSRKLDTENRDPNTKRIAICKYENSGGLIIFTSDKNTELFRRADKLSKKSEIFDLYLQKQKQGLAMPLLEVKFHKRNKFRSNKFLTINKFIPPPPHAEKLFNKHKDKFKFCTVFKDSGKMYDKYTFQFEKDPQNLSEGFETYLFYNNNVAISDIPNARKINERLRWARNRGESLPYTYSLYILDVCQPSMVDNMNKINMELDPQNKFLKFSPEQHMSFDSPHIVANLMFNSKSVSTAIERTARLDIKIPKDRRGLESESIHSVTPDELTFIANSLIFKYIEGQGRVSKPSLQSIFVPPNSAGYNFDLQT